MLLQIKRVLNRQQPVASSQKPEAKKKPRVSTRLVIKDRQRLTLPGFTLVPSALTGLTALFGMGRGDPRRYSHLKILAVGL